MTGSRAAAVPVLAWRDVTCAHGAHVVFSGFSGRLDAGERVRLVAPSGAGKTSFFDLLLGFARPAAGEIRLLGRRLDEMPRTEARACVGAVLQEPDLGGVGTVREALRAPFAFRVNRAAAPSEELLAETLGRLGLPRAVLDAPAASVSGGERQRLACAAALLLPRRAWLLDEPFAALDAANARRVAEAFADRTLLYTTHADPVPGFATREVALP